MDLCEHARAKSTKTRHKKYAYFQHFCENTGKYRNEKKYRKIQEELKNTGIYRKYRNAGSTDIYLPSCLVAHPASDQAGHHASSSS